MKRTPLLIFALQEKRWVGIDEVSSGLKCNCTCPSCGDVLVAKKGAKKRHHFAHASGFVCKGGLETALHRYVKYLIAHKRGIQTPAIRAYRGPLLRSTKWEQYDTATVEYSRAGARYDVLLQREGCSLAVEIKVSHKTGFYKMRLAAKAGLNVLEIDAGKIYDELITTSVSPSITQLNAMILASVRHRKWLVNLWQHRYEYRLLKLATKRKVIMSTQGGYYHYHVYHCPLRKRFVRSGFREGQSYARLFQDCIHCSACRKIEYDEEWAGFQQVPGIPRFVCCNEEC